MDVPFPYFARDARESSPSFARVSFFFRFATVTLNEQNAEASVFFLLGLWCILLVTLEKKLAQLQRSKRRTEHSVIPFNGNIGETLYLTHVLSRLNPEYPLLYGNRVLEY